MGLGGSPIGMECHIGLLGQTWPGNHMESVGAGGAVMP